MLKTAGDKVIVGGNITIDNTELNVEVAASDGDSMISFPGTGAIYSGTTALTPKFIKIDLAASGDLIALVSAKKLRVVSMFLSVAGDTTLKFQSGATTDLTGAMTLKAGGGFVFGFSPAGYIESASGEKLNLVMGSSVQVSGGITYIEV